MTETSWHQQLRRWLIGYEPPAKPAMVPPDNGAETETHNQSIGRAYVQGMLVRRQKKDLKNPYYRDTEQARAWDSGHQDEGLR